MTAPSDNRPNRIADSSTVDDIIVGAGSAGCILAARLSEDPDRTVLLLEAGERPRGIVARMPAASGINFIRPRYNWCLETVKQAELGNRTVFIAAGKGLGGSSAINAMCYMRGHPADYDSWAKEGLRGWAHAEVLPYFMRNESYASSGDPAYRGYDGPFRTVKADVQGPIQEAFLRAGETDAGLTDDPNGFRQEGFFACDRAIRDGVRETTATAYLDPAKHRPNLRIETGVLVHRVMIENGCATGIEATIRGETRILRARRETVLSAGAIRSPQLLMLSGIGPADHLRSFDIPVVLDQPSVGSHLEDHIEAQITFRCREPVSHSRYMQPARRAAVGLQWLLFRSGIGATTGFEVGALLRSAPERIAPDLQIYLYPALIDGVLPDARAHGFGLGMDFNRCRSRGTIRLASADPAAAPAIDPAYLSDPADLDIMVDAIERARDIASSRAFDAVRGVEIGPGAEVKDRQSIAAWIRTALIGNWHLASSCRMGTDGDSVTDAEGRVHGIGGLRVVDASILPHVPNANPAATVMMAAEKIADAMRGRAALAPRHVLYHRAAEAQAA